MNSGREYTPESFRISLEARLKQMAAKENIDLQRLRCQVAVGQHGESLVMVPYEQCEGKITPVTVHVTSRQQIQFRIKTGRFANE